VYKLGQTEKLEVCGVTFTVRKAAGPRFKYIETMRQAVKAAQAGDVDLGGGESIPAGVEVTLAMVQAQRDLADALIVDAEGIQDASGKNVKWKPEILDEFDQDMIRELVGRLTGQVVDEGEVSDSVA